MAVAINVLDVNNLSFTVDDKEILKDISFGVKRGEFIGIIGPNGVGKSTLLKSIRGFLPLSAGQVCINGTDIRALSDRELARLIAFMQQEVQTDFNYTSLQIVLVGRYPYLKWWQNESANDLAIARRNMDFTGVSHLIYMPVNVLSGGERQRVLFAKVLTQQADILLLDEPTANLDLVYQEELFRCCRQLAQEGKTILVVAHDLKLASKFCSRLILLADGTILADGNPAEVVTAQNLADAYGLSALVFTNKITGQLDLYTYEPMKHDNRNHIHIIGGGGSAGAIMRAAFENGYIITAGVLHNGDSDVDVAHAFNIAALTTPAFSEINFALFKKNCEAAQKANLVILTNVCYSLQNIKNLEAAFKAKRLIIIEDTPFQDRDFTDGSAERLYRELCRQINATVMTSRHCLTLLKSGRF